MTSPSPTPLSAGEREQDPPERQSVFNWTIRVTKWGAILLLVLTAALIGAWPWRLDIANQAAPAIVSKILRTPVYFRVTILESDRIEVTELDIENGPAARRITLRIAEKWYGAVPIQSVEVDGLRVHAIARSDGGLDIRGLPASEDGGNGLSGLPLHELTAVDAAVFLETPIGPQTVSGNIELTLQNAPSLFPVSGALKLEARESESAILASFFAAGNTFNATGSLDLSLKHWLPLIPQIQSATGRVTAQFDLATAENEAGAASRLAVGRSEIAWTGAKVSFDEVPEIAFVDGLAVVSNTTDTVRVSLPRPLEMTADRLPPHLLQSLPATILPYLDGSPQVTVSANGDTPAATLSRDMGDQTWSVAFESAVSVSLGPLSGRIVPVHLSLSEDFAPESLVLRQSSLSVIRGLDLPRDIAAHVDLGTVELDIAAFRGGSAIPAMDIPFAIEGTLNGTVADPVWVRQATFRGEGQVRLKEAFKGIDLRVEPGGQIRIEGLTGTGDIRFSPHLRIDVAGRDPMRLSADFADPTVSLAAQGGFRLGEMSVAIADSNPPISFQFGRQPVSLRYNEAEMGLVMGPVDVRSPELGAGLDQAVLRASLAPRTGTVSISADGISIFDNPLLPGAFSSQLALSYLDNGGIVAEGPISLAAGRVTANLRVQADRSDGQTAKIRLETAPLIFGGPGGLRLSDVVPAKTISELGSPPDLEGAVSAEMTLFVDEAEQTGVLRVKTEGLDISSSEGALNDLAGTLEFDMAKLPATNGAQSITGSVNLPGLPNMPLSAQFSVTPDMRLAFESVSLGLFGGTVALVDTMTDPGAGTLEGTIRLRRVNLQDAMSLIDIEGVTATGRVSGLVPIRFDGNEATLSGGSIGADGGGTLKIDNPSVNQALDSDEDAVQLMTDVLKDFHYDSLSAELDLPPGKSGTVRLHLAGRNPSVLEGHPFQINVSLESDFRELFRLLEAFLDISSVILGKAREG